MSTHARLSPSGASRWLRCPGSVAMEDGLADSGSKYADEGTAGHWLAEHCLRTGFDASKYIAFGIDVEAATGDCAWHQDKKFTDFTTFFIDLDFATGIQVYVDNVREYAIDGELLVEQRLPISHITGEADAHGTSDAVIIKGSELQVHDLKWGRGNKIDAEENEQLMLYALGAFEEFSVLTDFDRVVMVIHQPRLQHLSEWSCSVDDLVAFGRVASGVASTALALTKADAVTELYPGEDQCRWCKAKATCPALARRVQEVVCDDFETVVTEGGAPDPGRDADDDLSIKMQAVDLIESWCGAVRAEVERRLLAGTNVPGYKLVEGRRGARAWSSKEEAEQTLKSMRLKHEQMYDYSIISPTTAEKLAKANVIGPKQWPKLQQLITQSNGKPSVAPASDKRPALVMTPVEDDFTAEDDFADLLGGE